MKAIDWNKASELGLIRRINEEVLHPLGLAMTRTVETGSSDFILISDDGIWEYPEESKNKLTKEEILEKIQELKDE